jgi:hypothetical protein
LLGLANNVYLGLPTANTHLPSVNTVPPASKCPTVGTFLDKAGRLRYSYNFLLKLQRKGVWGGLS